MEWIIYYGKVFWCVGFRCQLRALDCFFPVPRRLREKHAKEQISAELCQVPTYSFLTQKTLEKNGKQNMLNKWQKPFGSAFFWHRYEGLLELGGEKGGRLRFAFGNWILLCNLFLVILMPRQWSINMYLCVVIRLFS